MSKKIIQELEPKNVFKRFIEVSEVPRHSDHPEDFFKYITELFKDKEGITIKTDKYLNVYVRKHADKGCEKKEPILFQAHTDMVCVKDPSSNHDFLKDPIELVIDKKREWIYGNKTTLGCDNGLGVAFAIEFLLAKDKGFGIIEAIFTTHEETDLSGIINLGLGDEVISKKLINLDGEKLNTLAIGSTGIIKTFSNNKIKRKKRKYHQAHKLSISGLIGGHSGGIIHEIRINAIKYLTSLLWEVINEGIDFELIEFNGGEADNVIAPSAYAIIAFDDCCLEKIKLIANDFYSEHVEQYSYIEKTITQNFDPIDDERKAINNKLKNNLICFAHAVHSGMFEYDKRYDTMKSSANFGILRTHDDLLEIVVSYREKTPRSKKAMFFTYSELARFNNLSPFNCESELDGYITDDSCKLIQDLSKIMTKEFGTEPKKWVTAGVTETGMVKKKCKSITEAVSLGLDVENIHCIDERMGVNGVGKIWNILTEFLSKA